MTRICFRRERLKKTEELPNGLKMDDKYKTSARVPVPRITKEGRRNKQQDVGLENEELEKADLEVFSSETGMRKRQPGSISRKILQGEGEEGQPLMRFEPKRSPQKSIDSTSSKNEEIEEKYWAEFPDKDEVSKKSKSKSPTSLRNGRTWTDAADLHLKDRVRVTILAAKDFVIYAIYLTTLLLVIFGSKENAFNYYAKVVSDEVVKSKFVCAVGELKTVETFEMLKTAEHVWCFLEKVMLPFLYPQNGTSRWVSGENVLVGAPAMVQIRVKSDSCLTAYLFDDLFKTCYDYYHGDVADREDFGDGSLPFRWRQSSMDVPEGSLTYGSDHIAGGYQFNFTADYNFTKAWLKEIENKLWIRQGTRFVVMDFALYAPEANLFLVVKLDFKFFPTGGVITNSFFHTWKILRFVSKWDMFLLGAEVINFMFVLFFVYEESVQIRVLGCEYLANWWNVLDNLIIFLSFATYGLGLLRWVTVRQTLPEKIGMIGTSKHASFNDLMNIHRFYVNVGSMLVFISWLKLFKFTALFRSVRLILTSITWVLPELSMMLLQVFIISIGYAIFGKTVFGDEIVQFSSTTTALFSMTGIYVGRMHFYKKCMKSHPIIGPLFFGSYIIVACMIHLNAFVAIVVHGYREAHSFLNEEPERQYMGDLLFNTVIQLLNFFGCERLLRKMLIKDIINRRCVDYDEFVLVLNRHNLHGLERRLLLIRYELKRKDEMFFDAFLEIYNDILTRHQLRVESNGHQGTEDIIERTDQLATACEVATLDVQSKVDIIIDKLLSDSRRDAVEQKRAGKKKRWFN